MAAEGISQLRGHFSSRQNHEIPCNISCLQGIRQETGAVSTASPAKQSGFCRPLPTNGRKARRQPAFRPRPSVSTFPFGSPPSHLAILGAKLPKVSGRRREYSRF
jgi:hypothetical protein